MRDLHILGETSPCHTQWALQLRLIEDEPAPRSSLMLRHLRNHLSPLWTNVLLSSFGFTKAKPSFITPPTKENWIRSSHLQPHTWEVRKSNICPKKKKSKSGMPVVAMCVPGMHPDAVPASSYDRNSSSPPTALDGVKSLHFTLSLENQQSVVFRIQAF